MRQMRQLILAAGLKASVIVLPVGETPEENLQSGGVSYFGVPIPVSLVNG